MHTRQKTDAYGEIIALGLQLVQDLTRRNGSELTIESAEGEGSTFTFTIAKEQPRSETVEDTSGGIARP